MIIKKNQQKIKKPVIEVEVNEAEFQDEEMSVNSVVQDEDDIINLFDLDNIDFSQRSENRQGTRRRGFRRIDDRNLVSRAKEEAQSIKNVAYQEGYDAGIAKSTDDIIEVKEALKAFMSAKTEVFEFIAPDILEISSEIAKKIIKREVQADPQIMFDIILDVLKTISKGEPKIAIKVHPSQVEFVKDNLPEKVYNLGYDSKISVMADPAMPEGGCKFFTNNGIVDASIDTQVRIIKEVLKGI